MTTLAALHHWLRARLGPDGEMKGGADTEVQRLALALDPADLPDVPPATALWLHRSRRAGERFGGWPRLNSHDGFDHALTTGENWRLAQALGWQDAQRLGLTRAVGLIATPPQTGWNGLLSTLDAEFGGHEELLEPETPQVSRVALVNAMRPEVLAEVAAQGVQVYVTGQWRPGARPEAARLGLGVIALGHRRTERWGLRQLARELGDAFPGLECAVYGEP